MKILSTPVIWIQTLKLVLNLLILIIPIHLLLDFISKRIKVVTCIKEAFVVITAIQKTGTVNKTTHVWRHQNGGTDYLSEAAYAQFFGDGYEFDAAITKGKTWVMLNPEQQGQLITKVYLS